MKTNLKKISLILVMMIILVGVVACSNDSNDKGQDIVEPSVEDNKDDVVENHYLSIEDAFGHIVEMEKAPERIISLAPSNTEILYALGLGDKIVGVTAFCDYPEEALEVDKVGDFNGINFEKVVELEPDLVVNYGMLEDDALKMYNDAGIAVISFIPESIDEVIETIKQISIATYSEDRGNDLVERMEEHRDEILAKVQDTEEVKVFYEIWHEPLMTAGAGSFVDGLINLANGVNVASDAEGEYPNYDIEKLIENDPEVYLTANDLPEKTAESIMTRPGYEDIAAIKNGKIYLLDGNIVSRPGPRIVEALEIIAQKIHPQAFE